MSDKNIVSVSCTSLSDTILQKARLFAKNLDLPFSQDINPHYMYTLCFSDCNLELRQNTEKKQAPIVVDFSSGSSGYRHHHDTGIRQPLAKAVGIKPGFRPYIVDGTAGLGGDSFVFATLGCRVLLCERSEIIGALLRDGIDRGSKLPGSVGTAVRKMHLVIGDTCSTLSTLAEKPYTVYLDPMYPHTRKSALNRKEMRVLRNLVGSDEDADTVLITALQCAENRVVVKRPKGAPYLGALSPSHSIQMKNSRFDVYLTLHL